MATILVIEDDSRLRDAVKEMLKRAGYDVLTASDGKVGVELYREKHPDLIITDLKMPVMAGHELISHLVGIKSSGLYLIGYLF